MVYFPETLKSLPQQIVLAIALALSAGVMIYVSFIEIFVKSHESIAASDANLTEGGASALTTACFFAGMLVCVLLEMLVDFLMKRGGGSHDQVCVAHASTSHEDAGTSTTSEAAAPQVKVDVQGADVDNNEEKKRLGRMGVMTAAAIAIHNFPEGLATFLQTLEDARVGASLGVAIAIHNIPEGLCVAMPIYYATGNPHKAFFWSFLSGLTEPLGGIVGFAALQPVFTDMVFGIVFSMVGGMMVFIVCHELLPAAHRYMGNKAKVTGFLILGMFIMAISLVLFSDWDSPANGERRRRLSLP